MINQIPLSRSLAGRTLSPDEIEAVIDGPRSLETGIKVIDLFAPIQAGGINMIVTPLDGVGLLVVIGEIIHRIAHIEGGYTICVGLETEQESAADLMNGWQEMGVAQYLTQLTCGPETSSGEAQRVISTGTTVARTLLDEGQPHVALLVDARLAADHHEALRQAARLYDEGRAITVFYYGQEAPQLPTETVASRITFSQARASAQLWPAIDPVESESALLNTSAVTAEHRQIIEQARTWLKAHPPADGHSHLSDFLTQSFFVSEPWTGLSGEYLPIVESLKTVSSILDGDYAANTERPFYPFEIKQS